MNHHIPNALQVISLYSGKQPEDPAVAALGQAVNRIEWALSEVLPAELLGETLSGFTGPTRSSHCEALAFICY